MRIITESTHPPKKPDTAPHRVPKKVATRADRRPTIREI